MLFVFGYWIFIDVSSNLFQDRPEYKWSFLILTCMSLKKSVNTTEVNMEVRYYCFIKWKFDIKILAFKPVLHFVWWLDGTGEPFINGHAVAYHPKYHEVWERGNASLKRRKRENTNLRPIYHCCYVPSIKKFIRVPKGTIYHGMLLKKCSILSVPIITPTKCQLAEHYEREAAMNDLKSYDYCWVPTLHDYAWVPSAGICGGVPPSKDCGGAPDQGS